MTVLIAIDPSTTCTGLALFWRGRLDCTRTVKPPKERASNLGDRVQQMVERMLSTSFLPMFGGPLTIVYEWPQVYSDGDVDPNDLPAIAAVGAALTVALLANYAVQWRESEPKVLSVRPKEWTGTIPKKVGGKLLKKHVHTSPRAKRILSRLDEAEVVAFHNADTNDEIDAIGIGLHALGRGITQRHRVYPGAT